MIAQYFLPVNNTALLLFQSEVRAGIKKSPCNAGGFFAIATKGLFFNVS